MKIPVIKALVENHDIKTLVAAEEALLEEVKPEIEVAGDDEGEKLTHVFAAIWVLNNMQDNNSDFKTSLRLFTQKVRTSIN